MTKDRPPRRRSGMLLLGVLVAALGYLLVQALLDNAGDPTAAGHALLLIGGLCAVSLGLGWLVRRARR